MILWEAESILIPKCRIDLQAGLVQAYALILDQCSLQLWGKVEQFAVYENINRNKDPVLLLQRIRSIMCGREAHQKGCWSMAQLIKELALLVQYVNESNKAYKERLEGILDAIQEQGASLSSHPGLLTPIVAEIVTMNGSTDAQTEDEYCTGRDRLNNIMKTRFMLGGAHNSRHKALKEYLENAFTLGDNKYPNNTAKLLTMLNNFRTSSDVQVYCPANQNTHIDKDGLNFAKDGGAPPDTTTTHIRTTMAQDTVTLGGPCAHYGKNHWVGHCDSLTEEQLGEILIQLRGNPHNINWQKVGSQLLQQPSHLNKSFCYLDTCTTEDQMVNPSFLMNIHDVARTLQLQTNAGMSKTNQQGYLGNNLFWLKPDGIANVILLHTLEDHFHVTYDSTRDGGSFICHTPAGTVKFLHCPQTRFPYIDLHNNVTCEAIALIKTICKNYEGFTRHEVERAILACCAQASGGHPSEAVFKNEVSQKSTSSL